MALSIIFLILSQFVAPWYIIILSLPLAIYNGYRYKKRDHRLHFITKREYKQDFKRIEKAFLIKSVVYGLLIAASLVFFVLTLCDLISESSSSRSRNKRKKSRSWF